jgi:hypothetical protein
VLCSVRWKYTDFSDNVTIQGFFPVAKKCKNGSERLVITAFFPEIGICNNATTSGFT